VGDIKTLICNRDKASCRQAILAVRGLNDLQTFFACAGDGMSEGASRALFNRFASNPDLAQQLEMAFSTGTQFVTALEGTPMTTTCNGIVATCCANDGDCSSTSADTYMTVALNGCVGMNACAGMGPNAIVLESSCNGPDACNGVNANDAMLVASGVTFIGEVACTTANSCERLGAFSYGDVIVQNGGCVGANACTLAGLHQQQVTAGRRVSNINVGQNACNNVNACRDAHSSSGGGAKVGGSLSIEDGACVGNNACQDLANSDLMVTAVVVEEDECSGTDTCKGCVLDNCPNPDGQVYVISNAALACPKDGMGDPTGAVVVIFCVNLDDRPTECPTFAPTPLMSDIPSVLPSELPSQGPTRTPTESPSDLPSVLPSMGPSNFPSVLPSDGPTIEPTAAPTINKTPLQTLCLATPGDVSSMIALGPQVLCDDDMGICTNFVNAIESLPDNKDRLVKSILGCDLGGATVDVEVAQARFDTIKNDASAITAILGALEGSGIFLTGTAAELTAECMGSGFSCCNDGAQCTTAETDAIITMTPDSCSGTTMANPSCDGLGSDIIILGSCLNDNSCSALGSFEMAPNPQAVIGSTIIGPAACTNARSCQDLGVNIYGSIRIERAACNGVDSCNGMGVRVAQSSMVITPVLSDILVQEEGCQGQRSCQNVHRGTGKTTGSLDIGQNACMSVDSCNGAASSNDAVDDLVIEDGTCMTDNSCQNCVATDMCAGDPVQIYTIAIPNVDCPTPNGVCS